MKSVLMIFGATGNLMHKKLVPAIDALFQHQHLSEDTTILAISRREMDNDSYFDHLKTQVKAKVDWERLQKHITYVKVAIDQASDYEALKKRVDTLLPEGGNKLFYLAVSPELFVTIARGLSKASLIEKGDSRARIVFEKPFGVDFESAKEINQELQTFLQESQIYRIDHYLGKDMIQNMLVLRFANRLLENNWSHQAIESVDLIVKETEAVGTRGSYYDASGALKDMIQSHVLQMLALTAMEEPASMDAEDIRKEKVRVLKKTSILKEHALFGQYEGYLDEPGIPQGSNTETFIYLQARIDTPRWKGVSFRMMTGKKLDEKKAEIRIHFKSPASKLFPKHSQTQNQLIIGVSDYEGISFQMNVKTPGLNADLKNEVLDYCHSCHKIGNNPEAYEILLKEFLDGNRTLFTGWDEIEASWNVVDPLKKGPYQLMQYRSMDDFKEILSQMEAGELHVD